MSGAAPRVLGVARKSRGEVRIEPVDRRSKDTLIIAPHEAGGVNDGDLVLAQVLGAGERAYGPGAARSSRWSGARTIPAPPP